MLFIWAHVPKTVQPSGICAVWSLRIVPVQPDVAWVPLVSFEFLFFLRTADPSDPTWLGSSFRLPEPDIGGFWSVSLSFSPDVLFLFLLSVVFTGMSKKGALIEMMVKSWKWMLFPKVSCLPLSLESLVASSVLFGGALSAVTLDDQFPVV